MMIKAKFSSDMISILKDITGQTFLSYERAKEEISNSTYGNIRLNFSELSIDLANEQKEFTDMDEEISCFSCAVACNGKSFVPAIEAETEVIKVQETVSGIELVSDVINLNHGETILEVDSALILYTNDGCYVFARTEWFSEVIIISHNGDYNELYPIQSTIESWSNDGVNQVEVSRAKTKII